MKAIFLSEEQNPTEGNETAKNTSEPKATPVSSIPSSSSAPRAVHQTVQQQAPQYHESEEVTKLKAEIAEERKKKDNILKEMRISKRKLAYKMEEKLAISKLAEINQEKTKKIGYLRRRKEQFEFRIATEAFTLETERDLIRKKAEVEAELDDAIKSFRLRKKAEFIDDRIKQLTEQINNYSKQLDDIEKKLDILYPKLRGGRQKEQRHRPDNRQDQRDHKQSEISLADVAVIQGRESTDSEGDSSTLN